MKSRPYYPQLLVPERVSSSTIASRYPGAGRSNGDRCLLQPSPLTSSFLEGSAELLYTDSECLLLGLISVLNWIVAVPPALVLTVLYVSF